MTEAKDLIPIWMEEHRVPGVSITLFGDGDIAWSKDIGVRSTESGEEVTPDTIFEAASISKPVFAYAVLGLTRGASSISTPLSTNTCPSPIWMIRGCPSSPRGGYSATPRGSRTGGGRSP